MSSGEDSDSNYSSSDEDKDEDSEDNINPVEFFTVKELCYYKLIDKYFKSCSNDNIKKMMEIIEGTSNISLRVLDWVVTKFSKKKIDIKKNNVEMFDVRISYRSQLKSYKKRNFDPFRRRKKFIYHFNDDEHISTTLGQLNFFRWAFSNNVIEYVEKNLEFIGKEMNISNKEEKIKKVDKEKKVKKKKSDTDSKDSVKINAVKTVTDDEVQITLSFE